MASRNTAAEVVPEQFPVGLRVLVVDDHIPCLRIIEHMLRKCKYNVTTCSQATSALNLLRESKGCFDIVLSDVHMPDMDGFKLLELVGLEMGLPVIMMSADGRTNLVMRGVRHGACDYLIKPIREEELKNIWQHVVRRRTESKEHESSGCLEDNDRHNRRSDDAEYACSFNGADGVSIAHKKRKDVKEEDEAELECDDPSTAKKARVVWSVELHQQFVSAVNQLGIDKAVPKRILELMNVPGLTRENVASHLQKFRLYLKRLSGVAQQQGGFPNSFCGPFEANTNLGTLGIFDIQALAASAQIPPQTLAALQTEFFNQSAGTLVSPIIEQPSLLQAPLPGAKCIVTEQSMAYGQPLMKYTSNISRHFIQSTGSTEDVTSGIGMWPPKDLDNVVVPSSRFSQSNALSGSVLLSMMQTQLQRQSQQQERQKNQIVLSEPSRMINVQPSCVVVPPNTSTNFHSGSPSSVNQNCSLSRSPVMDYDILSPRSHNSSAVAYVSATEFRSVSLPSGFSGADSASPSMSCAPAIADNNAGREVPNSASTFVAPRQLSYPVSTMSYMQSSYNINRGSSIPSRFALNEPGLLLGNLNHGVVCGENGGSRIKLEPNTDFTGNAKVGIQVHSPANDLMSVLSD